MTTALILHPAAAARREREAAEDALDFWRALHAKNWRTAELARLEYEDAMRDVQNASALVRGAERRLWAAQDRYAHLLRATGEVAA